LFEAANPMTLNALTDFIKKNENYSANDVLIHEKPDVKQV